MKRSLIALIALFVLSGFVPAIADSADLPTSIREVFRQALPDRPGTDVTVITVDYAPGESTPPHEHPGETYAYVLKGAVVSQLDDEPPHTFTEGQMWSETPHQRHMVSRNASATEPARLLVFFIAPHGEKLTTMLPAKP